MKREACICHPLIESLGVIHGFGTRASSVPAGTLRPVQVHGINVIRIDPETPLIRAQTEADAIVCSRAGTAVAIATADCIPILACSESGRAVAAIHAGWRGLAAGVVEAGIQALREMSRKGEPIYVVIGPHIGSCCYEVDKPVLDAMGSRFGGQVVSRASRSTRPGHARLSLADLAEVSLDRAGVGLEFRARLAQSCTACEIDQFYSFRREGKSAGRMLSFAVTNSN